MFEALTREGMQFLRWVLGQVGLRGVVSAGAVVTLLGLVYYGYKMSWLLKMLRHAGRHALISSVLALAVIASGLYVGVIPGVNLGVLADLLGGAV